MVYLRPDFQTKSWRWKFRGIFGYFRVFLGISFFFHQVSAIISTESVVTTPRFISLKSLLITLNLYTLRK